MSITDIVPLTWNTLLCSYKVDSRLAVTGIWGFLCEQTSLKVNFQCNLFAVADGGTSIPNATSVALFLGAEDWIRTLSTHRCLENRIWKLPCSSAGHSKIATGGLWYIAGHKGHYDCSWSAPGTKWIHKEQLRTTATECYKTRRILF